MLYRVDDVKLNIREWTVFRLKKGKKERHEKC